MNLESFVQYYFDRPQNEFEAKFRAFDFVLKL